MTGCSGTPPARKRGLKDGRRAAFAGLPALNLVIRSELRAEHAKEA